MTILRDKYKELAPQGLYLQDTVVLAQAWKKSHTYVRRHNWYADMLELDSSTIDLEQQLAAWSADVQRVDFAPDQLRLVPAPKNAKWEFRQPEEKPVFSGFLELSLDDWGPDPSFSDWKAKRKPAGKSKVGDGTASLPETEQKLRPLAHLSIRDQTLATAVMMCLAEAVETAQGDTTEKDALKARAQGVVSYGNRLHCRWDGSTKPRSRAHFSWGNSRTYRQYFQDYRTFLARPRRICADFSAQVPASQELFVVSLDIRSFFDRVDCPALLKELKRIEGDYRRDFGLPDSLAADEAFWQLAERIFTWAWREADHKSATLMKGAECELLDLGLPQGLLASGFLANAYLVGLDRQMSGLVLAQHECNSFKVLDYCRYVDDVRIVVQSNRSLEDVLEATKKFFKEQLATHCTTLGTTKVLELSDEKCTITPYRSISAQSNVSALMEALQAEISGTFDMESLVQAAGGLDGLLWMAEQIEDAEPSRSRLRLANIARPNTDVRDDTVKRFVATRLAQSLRHRLAMTDSSAAVGSGDTLIEQVTNGKALAHEFESTARKLIKCWADNPSLVLLLRCGLDLFPHPKLLGPVTEALTTKLFHSASGNEELREVRVAEYVLADLFRAGAVETGFRTPDEYPESIDIAGYREDLGTLARRVLVERTASPWYLQQQALLFLASIQDHSLSPSSQEELSAYSDLHNAMLYKPVKSETLQRVLPFALVGQQLHPNTRRFGSWLAEGLRATPEQGLQGQIVTTVALYRPELISAAMATGRGRRQPSWAEFVPASLRTMDKKSTGKKPNLAKQKEITLLALTSSPLNPFCQENGLLLLAQALLRHPGIEKELSSGLDASEIRLGCQDWGNIQALPGEEKFLHVVRIERSLAAVHPLYEAPNWVEDKKAWLYGLGRVLRSAFTGELDYTSRRFLVTEEVGGYTGLRSSWFKRRFGLLNSGRGILDEPGPMSPWLSGFLSALLQWPGVEFPSNGAEDATKVRTPDELKAILERRISVQRDLYGSRCRTPMYVVPTDKHGTELIDRPMRIAVVQPLRPKLADFNPKDPTHWTASTLAEHRRHLAEVCRLACQQLKTWASAQPQISSDNQADQPVVDVVLFPELSVHPEHLFHLRTLSDKLKAHIFAGLTYMHSDKLDAPINQGIWLIRTETPGSGRTIQYAWQGKKNPAKMEQAMGIKGYRPHITLVEFPIGTSTPTRLAAAICYDATDLDLLADLRDRSDMFLVAAFNQDVDTFDNMVGALRFHMYQPVVLANLGEFGGSTAQAPLKDHGKIISHIHGNNQVAVSVFEIDPSPFKATKSAKAVKELKTAPAGYKGRPKAGV